MRRVMAGAMLMALVVATPAAAPVLDEELMPTIEAVSESLASSIGLQDVAAASTDAKDLDALFAEVEAHFRQQGGAEDAVGYARQSRELAATVLKALDDGKFDDAANAASGISRTCKSCHRKYKP